MVLHWKWGHDWPEIRKAFIQKQKEQIDRTNAFCKFLIELTQAAFGGKKSEEEIGLDSGEGIDELSDEQLENLRNVLGEADFQTMYGHLL